ncbi:MAG TPA: AarF/UbiB family protein [Gaiellaceae bacterium]|jgi:predicted unusual protein kinase regulating ubiquinone biosynthesis (AarF/ABC1/UbiB family)/nucleotide-binding universal stress UspA family protein
MKVVVATDRSETARQAVAWAADLARRFDGELVLLQVLPEPQDGAEDALRADAETLPGARAVLRVDPDVAAAIVRGAEEEAADVLVVGNAGMGGRKEFLLGNVPNRVSHGARCTVVIVNTTDGAVHEPPPEPVEGGLLGRAAEIGRVLARLGLDVRGAASVEERAGQLRGALEQLGPTFAKLGQILSTRPDLVSPELAAELAKLQDSVAPLTEEEVVRVMEQELRVPWEDVFASIEPEPLAAGTIGQVHVAMLESGERVVVKVQRPRARDEIMRDLGLLELFAEKALGREALRGTVDIPALVRHLSESLRRELDFLQEAANVDRMREVLAPYDRLGVPRVYHDLSTSRLLVLEFVEGVSIRASSDSEERRQAARQLLEAFYRQILVDGFFHADPHPGNLLWTGEKIVLLDLGMVGELGPELRELMIVLMLAFARNDPKFLSEAVLMLGGEQRRSDLDLDALEREFAAFIDRFQVGSLRDIQIGPMLEGMIQIASRHGIRLPASLALSGKAFGQIQLAIAELDPLLDPFRVVGDFLLRNVRERLIGQADPQHLYYEGQKLKLRLGRFVEAVERAAGARPGQKLQVDFIGSTAIEQAIATAARRLSLGAAAGAAIVGAAATAAAGTAGWVPIAFAAVGGAVGGWLALDLLRRR